MSQENTSVDLNVLPEVQVTNEAVSPAENSDMEHTNTADENTTIAKDEVGNIQNNTPPSPSGDVIVKATNSNSELESNVEEISAINVDASQKSDETKCDICSTVDVENITNSLAEKVNIKCTEPFDSSIVDVTKCDVKDKETTNKESVGAKPAIFPQNLLNVVKILNMSGGDHQGASQNKSTVILKQQTDSLKNLMAYESSSSDEAEEEESWQFRSTNKSDSDSDDDSDDSDDSDDTSSSEDDDDTDVG